MIRQRILLIWEQELVSLEVYCSLAYISLRIPWEEARIPANHTSICSVLVSFIDTAYRSMLVFSTHPDFSPPLSGVLPDRTTIRAKMGHLTERVIGPLLLASLSYPIFFHETELDVEVSSERTCS